MVGLTVLGLLLDLVILKIVSNLNDSKILYVNLFFLAIIITICYLSSSSVILKIEVMCRENTALSFNETKL